MEYFLSSKKKNQSSKAHFGKILGRNILEKFTQLTTSDGGVRHPPEGSQIRRPSRLCAHNNPRGGSRASSAKCVCPSVKLEHPSYTMELKGGTLSPLYTSPATPPLPGSPSGSPL